MKSNLKKLRKEAGLTMQQLSEKAGVARSQISKLEKGGGNPTMRTALFIGDALNKSVFEIWERE